MKSLKYIELAISSDKTRPNLNCVYRDVAEFVATDGHRLHFCNGQPALATGHYIDDRDEQFPDWRQVLPPTDNVEASIRFSKRPSTIRQLKAFVTCVSKFEIAPRITLDVVDGALLIEYKGSELEASLTLGLATLVGTTPLNIGMNAKYFLDAVELPLKETNHPVKINLRGSINDVIQIESEYGQAIIMPMRP